MSIFSKLSIYTRICIVVLLLYKSLIYFTSAPRLCSIRVFVSHFGFLFYHLCILYYIWMFLSLIVIPLHIQFSTISMAINDMYTCLLNLDIYHILSIRHTESMYPISLLAYAIINMYNLDKLLSYIGVRLMVFNATFKKISFISY